MSNKKQILEEQLRKMSGLMEATQSSSSGSYEEPMEFDGVEPIDGLMGIVVSDDAPDVTVVDITLTDEEPELELDSGDEIEDIEDLFDTLDMFTETTKGKQQITEQDVANWIKSVTDSPTFKEGAFKEYCEGKVDCDCVSKAFREGGHALKMAKFYTNVSGKCKGFK